MVSGAGRSHHSVYAVLPNCKKLFSKKKEEKTYQGARDASRRRISSPCPSTSAAAPVVSTRRCVCEYS